jgi:two-component system, OmpR family, phosphate regulon sensor histidine kinase PhoR
MSKKVIWTIIIIMTLALLGVGLIQYLWIIRSVNLDEKNFNDKVSIALHNVLEKLRVDAVLNYYENIGEDGASGILDDSTSTIQDRIKNVDFKAKGPQPNEMLESISAQNLDRYIHKELITQGIDLKYEYGVYSNELRAYIIENGNFVTTIGDTTKSSNVAAMNPLSKAEFKKPLFADDLVEPGYLNLLFPAKTQFLWSSVIPILLSSILFTGLILFCFSYTIWIIFRQKKVSEMKTDFINNMTHEFKTPIATISLASDSILSPTIIENKEKVSRFINIIKQENKRMLNQVEKVLQMAQIDKEEVTINVSTVDIHDLIESAIINSDLKILAKGGKITTELGATDPLVQGDGTHLSSIINNLLDNAEKYSPENPLIHVSTQNVKDGVEFSIQDNGIGMTKESVKLIFEKFYRVHTGNLHDIKGFGLGLSYVKAMVDAHRGKVAVKSELGKGSTFSIFIPHKHIAK